MQGGKPMDYVIVDLCHLLNVAMHILIKSCWACRLDWPYFPSTRVNETSEYHRPLAAIRTKPLAKNPNHLQHMLLHIKKIHTRLCTSLELKFRSTMTKQHYTSVWLLLPYYVTVMSDLWQYHSIRVERIVGPASLRHDMKVTWLLKGHCIQFKYYVSHSYVLYIRNTNTNLIKQDGNISHQFITSQRCIIHGANAQYSRSKRHVSNCIFMHSDRPMGSQYITLCRRYTFWSYPAWLTIATITTLP